MPNSAAASPEGKTGERRYPQTTVPPRKALAVTMGEPAGIGPDIILMAWARRRENALPPFFVLGDVGLFRKRAERLGYDLPLAPITSPHAAATQFPEALPIVDLQLPVDETPGKPEPANAQAVIAAIQEGANSVMSGHATALVTAPLHKESLYMAGFAHPGHTEFLGTLARENGKTAKPVMMLAWERLRVVPVTIHIPLKQVADTLSQALICETARVTARDLTRLFGISAPRLAVCGLNPHAGEGGALGEEEDTIIRPAIATLREEGLAVEGPFAADSLFHPEGRAGFDAILAMYHDQALIPFKTLAFHEGVNVTLGLPFVRTSPDHGTAFSLAGTGRANPASFLAALKLADAMAARQAVSG